LIGTLAAVYAWLITPIGGRYAMLVWAYSLAGFLASSGFNIIAYALLRHRGPQEAAHLARVEGSLVSHVPRTR
jgi:H+-transporting ATPase